MIQLKRISGPADEQYPAAMALYENNFVEIERRDADEHQRMMTDPCYHCCTVTDGPTVGIAFYWESDCFIYLEHLCIDPQYRQKGYGGQVLDELKAQGKPVILEIEPVIDEMTAKRLAFYERNGFLRNPYRHIQAKYRPGDADLMLWVLSDGRVLTAAEYADFNDFLHDRVQNPRA